MGVRQLQEESPGQVLSRDHTGVLDPEIWDILQTIPRALLSSLVLGTLYYDAKKIRDYPKGYKDETGIGVYAIGVGVAHRGNRWLSANELTRVIAGIERYVKGYHGFERHRGAPSKDEDCELHDYVMKVDSAFGKYTSYDRGHIEFIEDDSKLIKVDVLIKSLGQRAAWSLKLDPLGVKPMMQTPLYVGCSSGLEVRIPNHRLGTNLRRSNKAYGLLVSVMSAEGYQPVSEVVYITRLWELRQLPKAEVPVAALANCYITQDGGGFNRVECGDATGSTTKK